MSKTTKAHGVVRDPGTIFVSWNPKIEGTTENKTGKNWIIVVKNTSTDEEYSISVNPKNGKHYIHDLQPNTYFTIQLCKLDEQGDKEVFINFGTLLTYKSSISNTADTTATWSTDKDSLLKLTGCLWDALGSSHGKSNV